LLLHGEQGKTNRLGGTHAQVPFRSIDFAFCDRDK